MAIELKTTSLNWCLIQVENTTFGQGHKRAWARSTEEYRKNIDP